MLAEQGTKETVGCLFQPWGKKWGLRGDPFLWDEMSTYFSKEPLPISASQLMALIEKSFAQLVGCPISHPLPSIYVERFDHGGLSGGHICCEFWREEVLPELHSRYLALKYMDTMRSPRMIDKPCRYESYPGGCRFGATCRFHHSKPVAHTNKPIISHWHYNYNTGHGSVDGANTMFARRSSPPLMTPIAASAASTGSTTGYSHRSYDKNESQPVSVSPKSVLELMNSHVENVGLEFIPTPALLLAAQTSNHLTSAHDYSNFGTSLGSTAIFNQRASCLPNNFHNLFHGQN